MSDTMRNYEMLYIAAPQLDEEGLATLNERVSGWITTAGGEITRTNVWGRQRLAYAIKKQTEGTYVQVNFAFPPSALREFERSLRIDEDLLRHLITRPDED
jgi:small subunit ribosomal protein S6